MRIVIDANEAATLARSTEQIAFDWKRITVVLPPLVWAEIQLSPYYAKRLSALAKCNLMFGMDLHEVHAQLSCLNEEQIASFEPVISPKSNRHEKLILRMLQSHSEMIDQARRLKNDAASGSANIIAKIRGLNKSYKDAKSRGQNTTAQKFVTIDDAMLAMHQGLETQLLNDVTSNGTRPMRAISAQSLYKAVMSNMYLGFFMRLVVCINVGYGHAWMDEKLNIDPSVNRNDHTDMTIGLFAGDGDIIVTRDTKLRNAIRHIDPEQRVTLKTWEECVKSQGAEDGR